MLAREILRIRETISKLNEVLGSLSLIPLYITSSSLFGQCFLIGSHCRSDVMCGGMNCLSLYCKNLTNSMEKPEANLTIPIRELFSRKPNTHSGEDHAFQTTKQSLIDDKFQSLQ